MGRNSPMSSIHRNAARSGKIRSPTLIPLVVGSKIWAYSREYSYRQTMREPQKNPLTKLIPRRSKPPAIISFQHVSVLSKHITCPTSIISFQHVSVLSKHITCPTSIRLTTTTCYHTPPSGLDINGQPGDTRISEPYSFYA